jgi:hypothetical protein
MFSNIFTFFYIKRATQAALPRRLHHPKKMIVRLRSGSSRWTFTASTSPKKMVVGLWSGGCGFTSGRRCFVQSEWDTLPGSRVAKQPRSFTRPPRFWIRTSVPVTLDSSVGPQQTARRSWPRRHRCLRQWSPSTSLPRYPRVDDVVSTPFAGGRLPLPCPFLSSYRFLQLSLFSELVPPSPWILAPTSLFTRVRRPTVNDSFPSLASSILL